MAVSYILFSIVCPEKLPFKAFTRFILIWYIALEFFLLIAPSPCTYLFFTCFDFLLFNTQFLFIYLFLYLSQSNKRTKNNLFSTWRDFFSNWRVWSKHRSDALCELKCFVCNELWKEIYLDIGIVIVSTQSVVVSRHYVRIDAMWVSRVHLGSYVRQPN